MPADITRSCPRLDSRRARPYKDSDHPHRTSDIFALRHPRHGRYLSRLSWQTILTVERNALCNLADLLSCLALSKIPGVRDDESLQINSRETQIVFGETVNVPEGFFDCHITGRTPSKSLSVHSRPKTSQLVLLDVYSMPEVALR